MSRPNERGLPQNAKSATVGTSRRSDWPQVNVHPGEFTIHTLMRKLLDSCEEKMGNLINLPLEQSFSIEGLFAQDVDGTLDGHLFLFAQISVHEASSALDALLRWIEAKHTEFDSGYLKQRMESAPKMSSKEVSNILYERRWLSADYIFCRIIIEILTLVENSSELREEVIVSLENFAFEHLKGYLLEHDVVSPTSPNFLATQNKWAQLIGSLSRIRFVVVTERIISFLESDSTKEIAGEFGVRALRYIQLKLYPLEAFEETISFVKACGELFHEAPLKIKPAFIEVFVNWFTPIAAITEAEVNIPAWMKNIETLYGKALKMLSKPKHQLVFLPLVCSLLCVGQTDFFLKNWYTFIELCSRLFKDKTAKQMALACCTRVLWVHFYRCESSQSNVIRLIEIVAKFCFPPGRRHIIPTDTSLELFIQLVHYCGVRQLEFSMKHLIYPLLLPDHSFDSLETIGIDRTIIAFRAFAKIIEDIRVGGVRPTFQLLELSRWTCPDHTLSPVVNDALSPETAKKLGILPHLDKMNEYAGEAMRLLHSSIGIYLSKHDKYTNKSSAEVVPRERLSHIELMKTLMNCMPRVFPGGFEKSSLADILALYVIHIDKSLASCASDTLRRIVSQCAEMRPLVVMAVLNLAVSIPYRHSLLLENILNLSGDLLDIWRRLADAESIATDEKALNYFRRFSEDLEGKCLMLLCNWLPKVRSASFRCIGLIHDLWKYHCMQMGTLNNPENEARDRCTVFDVAQEHGPYIVKRNYIEESLIPSPKNEQFIPKGITLFKLAENEAALDQLIWVQCFSNLLQLLYEKCPKTINPCWPDIVSRLFEIQQLIETAIHNESSSSLGFAPFNLRQETISGDLLHLWKNYLSFACCICPSDTVIPRVPVIKGKIISARSLFKSVLPILRSDNSLVRSSIVAAIGRVNCHVYRILLEELQACFQAALDDLKSRSQKNKKRLDRMRLDMAQIYYLTSDLLSYDLVLDDETIVRLVLDYVMETKAFLIQSSSHLAWEIHMLRYYYCRIVQKFYGPASAREAWLKYFPPEIRASLFYFFEEWSGTNNLEEMEKKNWRTKCSLACWQRLRKVIGNSPYVVTLRTT